MKLLMHTLPLTGLLALTLAGCQTQSNPLPGPTVAQPAAVQATPAPQAVTPTRTRPKYDPLNDPLLRNDNNDSGGGGGGNDSPGGGGGGNWG